ncbi:MAG: hypothetical protein FWE21_04040 [Defluviitaleaceae bacterium]|nr:hypothetical protein [Defluviitaleaceae bacterium]
MKNKLRIVVLMLTILLFVAAGCGENQSSHPVSTDGIAAIYESAREAITWFQKSTMEVDWQADGGIYAYDNFWHPVIHETISTLADLEAHLRQLFVADLADDLLFGEFVRYRDFDGVLHGIAADRGSNIFAGEETHEIIHISDYELIYRVSVNIHTEPPCCGPLSPVDYVDVHDFYMIFVDGNWIFQNFNLVR